MTIQVAAFRWVPEFAQGFVRAHRVRWALEEAGLPYEVVLIGLEDTAVDSDYRTWQPFGQVPAYRDDQIEMFESGAIVLHLARMSEALSPSDPQGRARTTSWVIAALNSIEPHVVNYVSLDTFYAGQAWTVERRPQARAILELRLAALSTWLGDKPYLETHFSAGDIIMTCVLRELVNTDLLVQHPNLAAYVRRCEARPAFGLAMTAQMQTYRDHAPPEA